MRKTTAIDFRYSDEKTTSQIPRTLYNVCVKHGFTDIYTFYDEYRGIFVLSIGVPDGDGDNSDEPIRQIYIEFYETEGREVKRYGAQQRSGYNFWTRENFTYSDGAHSSFVDGVWSVSGKQIAEIASLIKYILNSPPKQRRATEPEEGID